jgi:integrin beta 3
VEELEDGGRILVRKYLKDGVVVKEFRHVTATVIHRGVYKDGKTYQRGDQVSWGGSTWHANEDTDEKPESSKHWQLSAKRGRDGKEGKDGKLGERGPQGNPGLNGRNY